MVQSRIVKKFKPDVAIGTGGYASGPLLYKASRKQIPTLILEQNSYPGITNKLLGKTVNKICVAYEGMEKYFPKEKITVTGSPIRKGNTGSKTYAKRRTHIFWTGCFKNQLCW